MPLLASLSDPGFDAAGDLSSSCPGPIDDRPSLRRDARKMLNAAEIGIGKPPRPIDNVPGRLRVIPQKRPSAANTQAMPRERWCAGDVVVDIAVLDVASPYSGICQFLRLQEQADGRTYVDVIW